MADRTKELRDVMSAKRALARARRREAAAQARFEAAVVRAARAGASQREIAALAGVSQPHVSHLVAANRDKFVPHSKLGYLLAAHRQDVIDIAAEFDVHNVTVFGSVAQGLDGPNSDIDLLADIPDDMGLLALARLEQELQQALGVAVDLTPSRLVKPALSQSIMSEAAPL